MNQHEHQESLEDVLNDYIASTDGPSRESLIEWVRRYPHYAKELAEFTTSWFVLEEAEGFNEDSDIDEESLIARGMEVVHGILNKPPPTEQKPNEGPIVNLIEEGASRGFTQSALATQIGLGTQTLTKLNRGFIRLASIPTELIDRIADALQCGPSSVFDFFRRGPRLAMKANYRATKRPTLGTQQDFFDAVRDDSTMSEEYKAFWRDIEAKTERK